MNINDKLLLASVIEHISMLSQGEQTITIKNYRSDLVDAPVTINTSNGCKRGKKGKSLKDWH